MPKVLIPNFLLEPLAQSLINAGQQSGRIDGLTQLKLAKGKRAIIPEFQDYADILPDLKDTHIKKDKKGNFKTESENGAQKWVFKSEKDEKKFLEVAQKKITVDLPYLLRESDLKQLKVSAQELEYLLLIVEGEAELPKEKPAKNGKSKQPAT